MTECVTERAIKKEVTPLLQAAVAFFELLGLRAKGLVRLDLPSSRDTKKP